MGSCMLHAWAGRGVRGKDGGTAWRRSVFDDDAMRGPSGSSRLRFSDSGTCSEREPRTSSSPTAPHHCLATSRPTIRIPSHTESVVVIAFLDDIEFRATGQGGAGPAGDSFGGVCARRQPCPTRLEVVAGPPPLSRADMAIRQLLHVPQQNSHALQTSSSLPQRWPVLLRISSSIGPSIIMGS